MLGTPNDCEVAPKRYFLHDSKDQWKATSLENAAISEFVVHVFKMAIKSALLQSRPGIAARIIDVSLFWKIGGKPCGVARQIFLLFGAMPFEQVSDKIYVSCKTQFSNLNRTFQKIHGTMMPLQSLLLCLADRTSNVLGWVYPGQLR